MLAVQFSLLFFYSLLFSQLLLSSVLNLKLKTATPTPPPKYVTFLFNSHYLFFFYPPNINHFLHLYHHTAIPSTIHVICNSPLPKLSLQPHTIILTIFTNHFFETLTANITAASTLYMSL